MEYTNKVIAAYLRLGETYESYLKERRSFIERNGSTGELRGEIRELREAEHAYLLVMGALWHLEPEDRALLMDFYSRRKTSQVIAEELNISESTFWRRKRSAMLHLTERLSGM